MKAGEKPCNSFDCCFIQDHSPSQQCYDCYKFPFAFRCMKNLEKKIIQSSEEEEEIQWIGYSGCEVTNESFHICVIILLLL